jgi:uncharacterized membrane protein YeaQ/YmgE (transglycosylase-associated protein family)
MGLALLIAWGALVGWFARRRLLVLRRMRVREAIALAIAGALCGGFLTCAVTRWSISDLHFGCLLGSAIGAYAVLLVSSRVFPRRIAT